MILNNKLISTLIVVLFIGLTCQVKNGIKVNDIDSFHSDLSRESIVQVGRKKGMVNPLKERMGVHFKQDIARRVDQIKNGNRVNNINSFDRDLPSESVVQIRKKKGMVNPLNERMEEHFKQDMARRVEQAKNGIKVNNIGSFDSNLPRESIVQIRKKKGMVNPLNERMEKHFKQDIGRRVDQIKNGIKVNNIGSFDSNLSRESIVQVKNGIKVNNIGSFDSDLPRESILPVRRKMEMVNPLNERMEKHFKQDMVRRVDQVKNGIKVNDINSFDSNLPREPIVQVKMKKRMINPLKERMEEHFKQDIARRVDQVKMNNNNPLKKQNLIRKKMKKEDVYDGSIRLKKKAFSMSSGEILAKPKRMKNEGLNDMVKGKIAVISQADMLLSNILLIATSLVLVVSGFRFYKLLQFVYAYYMCFYAFLLYQIIEDNPIDIDIKKELVLTLACLFSGFLTVFACFVIRKLTVIIFTISAVWAILLLYIQLFCDLSDKTNIIHNNNGIDQTFVLITAISFIIFFISFLIQKEKRSFLSSVLIGSIVFTINIGVLGGDLVSFDKAKAKVEVVSQRTYLAIFCLVSLIGLFLQQIQIEKQKKEFFEGREDTFDTKINFISNI